MCRSIIDFSTSHSWFTLHSSPCIRQACIEFEIPFQLALKIFLSGNLFICTAPKFQKEKLKNSRECYHRCPLFQPFQSKLCICHQNSSRIPTAILSNMYFLNDICIHFFLFSEKHLMRLKSSKWYVRKIVWNLKTW